MARVDPSSSDIGSPHPSHILSPVEALTMKRVPIDVKILKFLATQYEPVTISQIDEEIDCYPNIIASYLKDLTEKGLVVTYGTKPKTFSLDG